MGMQIRNGEDSQDLKYYLSVFFTGVTIVNL